MTDGPDRVLAGPFRHVLVRTDGPVLQVTLHRPEVRNALHQAAHRELNLILDAYSGDPSLRVAVLTGSGRRAFCAGTDLKRRAAGESGDHPSGGFAGLTSRFDLDKPVIAAVNGLALGGGLEIVLACDLAVAAEHARFGFPEPRVGLAALSGGIQRLVRQIPYRHAMGMLLTGRQIDARRALQFGILNEVVPADQLRDSVQRWVSRVLACAPLAVRATKQTARRSLDEPTLASAVLASCPAAAEMLASRDAREGPRAFAARRRPVWRGR